MYKILFRSFLIIFLLIITGNVLCQISQLDLNNDLCFKDQSYFINPDYIARNEYFPDDHTHSGVDLAQEEVYQAALNVASECSGKVIADIGCGSGFKLLKYFSEFNTIGFELEPNFAFLKSRYPERTWYYGNFSQKLDLPFFDVIICADVIEHLVDPDQLLNWIRRLDFNYLVISTPDKDKLPLYQNPPMQSQTGPPLNPHHIREWSFAEFEQYLSQYFDIKKHFHNNIEWMAQVIVATKKDKK